LADRQKTLFTVVFALFTFTCPVNTLWKFVKCIRTQIFNLKKTANYYNLATAIHIYKSTSFIHIGASLVKYSSMVNVVAFWLSVCRTSGARTTTQCASGYRYRKGHALVHICTVDIGYYYIWLKCY
jgi:hypothetical protein